jgi:hypothetical protein
MNPFPTYHLSGLDTPVAKHALVLVGDDGACMRASGSGVLIAPRLALTAKHVVEDLWTRLSRSNKAFTGVKPLTAEFRILALQFVGSADELVLWTVEKAWGSAHSDLCILALAPLSVNALNYTFEERLTLRASPPLEGSRVAAFGYSGSNVEAISREPNLQLRWGLNPATTDGIVLTVLNEMRDRSLLNFPCFEINARFEGGMSGGPVFNEAGELCGIVCSSVTPEQGVSHIAYSATLWPVLGVLIDFEAPGIVVSGPYTIADMARIGQVHLRGWEALAPRVAVVRDETGRERLVLR